MKEIRVVKFFLFLTPAKKDKGNLLDVTHLKKLWDIFPLITVWIILRRNVRALQTARWLSRGKTGWLPKTLMAREVVCICHSFLIVLLKPLNSNAS